MLSTAEIITTCKAPWVFSGAPTHARCGFSQQLSVSHILKHEPPFRIKPPELKTTEALMGMRCVIAIAAKLCRCRTWYPGVEGASATLRRWNSGVEGAKATLSLSAYLNCEVSTILWRLLCEDNIQSRKGAGCWVLIVTKQIMQSYFS